MKHNDQSSKSLALVMTDLDAGDWPRIEHLLRLRAESGRHAVFTACDSDAVDELASLDHPDVVWIGTAAVPNRRPAVCGVGGGWVDSPQERLRALADDGAFRAVEWLPPMFEASGAPRVQSILCDADRMYLSCCIAPTEDALSAACKLLRMSEDQIWHCRDGWSEHRLGGSICPMRFGPRSRRRMEGRAILYHGRDGAPIGMPSERIDAAAGIWASPSRAFASCFAIPAVREGRLMHGLDLLQRQPEVVVSGDACSLRAAVDRPRAALHRLVCKGSNCRPAGACDGLELLVSGSVDIEAIELDDCRALLMRHGVRLEADETDAIGCLAAFGVDDAVWRAAFEVERETIERYPSLRRMASTWVVEYMQLPPRLVPGLRPEESLRYLRRVVLPELAERVGLAEVAGHGERHSWIVAHLALLLAFESDAPPVSTALAGALHDAFRVDDTDEPHGTADDHAVRGADNTTRIIRDMRSVHASVSMMEAVSQAIREHRREDCPSSPVSACLRDADRLGLAWERGYESRYFSTPAGRWLAAGGPSAAERLFRSRFGEPLFGTAPLPLSASARGRAT